MAKRYDAAIKHLVEAHPADWLAFAGLPAAAQLKVIGELSDAWAATFILIGLRFPGQIGLALLKGIRDMKESTTYQLILEEGEIKEARSLVLRLGRRRFGSPPQAVVTALEAIQDLARLEQIAERLVDVTTWDELIAQ